MAEWVPSWSCPEGLDLRTCLPCCLDVGPDGAAGTVPLLAASAHTLRAQQQLLPEKSAPPAHPHLARPCVSSQVPPLPAPHEAPCWPWAWQGHGHVAG